VWRLCSVATCRTTYCGNTQPVWWRHVAWCLWHCGASYVKISRSAFHVLGPVAC
jgi:hypothetical protein